MDRRREVSEATRLLSATRLLTLSGVGGVSKTRLALRGAAGVRRAFADGVWLVIAQRAAEGHVERILTKLGCTTRTRLAAWVAQQQGKVRSP